MAAKYRNSLSNICRVQQSAHILNYVYPNKDSCRWELNLVYNFEDMTVTLDVCRGLLEWAATWSTAAARASWRRPPRLPAVETSPSLLLDRYERILDIAAGWTMKHHFVLWTLFNVCLNFQMYSDAGLLGAMVVCEASSAGKVVGAVAAALRNAQVSLKPNLFACWIQSRDFEFLPSNIIRHAVASARWLTRRWLLPRRTCSPMSTQCLRLHLTRLRTWDHRFHDYLMCWKRSSS